MGIFQLFHETAQQLSIYLPLSGGIPFEKFATKVYTKTKVDEGKHIAIVGRTGMGKTTLVKALIRAMIFKNRRLNRYYLDTKKLGDFNNRDGKIIYSATAPPPITGVGQSYVWQPVSDDLEEFSKWFLSILAVGLPAIVYVDESVNLKKGDKVPRGYEILAKQGRLPGIHLYTGTAEVARAPRQMVSQCTHIVCFNVWNLYDTSIMKKYLRIFTKSNEPLPIKGKFSFLHLNVDTMGSPKHYTDYRQFIKEFMGW